MKLEIYSTCQQVKKNSTLFNLLTLHRKLKELIKRVLECASKGIALEIFSQQGGVM